MSCPLIASIASVVIESRTVPPEHCGAEQSMPAPNFAMSGGQRPRTLGQVEAMMQDINMAKTGVEKIALDLKNKGAERLHHKRLPM